MIDSSDRDRLAGDVEYLKAQVSALGFLVQTMCAEHVADKRKAAALRWCDNVLTKANRSLVPSQPAGASIEHAMYQTQHLALSRAIVELLIIEVRAHIERGAPP